MAFRKVCSGFMLALVGMAGFGASAQSQSYPNHTVHFVTGVPPGGGGDALTRLLAKKLSDKWGQPVVVDNKTGADQDIATASVATAPPDGYTLLQVATNLAIRSPNAPASFDPVKSFAPIILVAEVPDVLVTNPAKVPVKSLADFIAYAKANPGKLNFGYGGSFQFLQAEELAKLTGLQMVGVPFRGGAPAVLALLAGDIQLMFGSVTAVAGQTKGGALLGLAIGGQVRAPAMPDVPTFAEAAKLQGMDAGWYGVVAPAGTPDTIVAKLHDDMAAIIAEPDTQDALKRLGFFPTTSTAADFGRKIASEVDKWSSLMKSVSLPAEAK